MQRQLRKTNSQNLENASEILVDGYKLMVKRYLSVRTYLGEKGDRRRDEAVRQQCDHVHLPHATCLPFARRTATDATHRMNPPFAACLPLTPGRRSRWAAACAGPSPSPGHRPSQAVAFARSSPQPSPSSIPILLFATFRIQKNATLVTRSRRQKACTAKDPKPKLGVIALDGGPSGVRTLDLGIKSPLLYQLS